MEANFPPQGGFATFALGRAEASADRNWRRPSQGAGPDRGEAVRRRLTATRPPHGARSYSAPAVLDVGELPGKALSQPCLFSLRLCSSRISSCKYSTTSFSWGSLNLS